MLFNGTANRLKKVLIVLAIFFAIILYIRSMRVPVKIIRSYDYYNEFDDGWVYPGTTGLSVFSVYKGGYTTYNEMRRYYYDETHRNLDDDIQFDSTNEALVVCHGVSIDNIYYYPFLREFFYEYGGDYYYSGRAEKKREDDPRIAHIYIIDYLPIEF